jgi:hypothetical protein
MVVNLFWVTDPSEKLIKSVDFLPEKRQKITQKKAYNFRILALD